MDASQPPEPANLRFLRRLVTVLTAVMICGVIAIAAALVIALNRPPQIGFPDVALPEGERAVGYAEARGMAVIVTHTGRVLAFDLATGAPVAEAVLEPR